MKLLKSLSSIALAFVFVLAFSCAPKSSTESEESTTEETVIEEIEVVEGEMEMEMDSTEMDSEAMEAVDSASMEN